MAVVHLDSLPAKTTKGTLIRLLIQVGGLDRRRIGKIELQGRSARIDVPDDWLDRLVRNLDGTSLDNQHIRASHGSRSMSMGNEEEHFERLVRLLNLEAEAEARQAAERMRSLAPQHAERTGESLVDLVVKDETMGLGGRTLVTFAKRNERQSLPWTRLGTGAPVLISGDSEKTDHNVRGVVCERGDREITVAMSGQWPDQLGDSSCRMDLAGDEIARQRQQAALERASGAHGDRLAELRAILLGKKSPEFSATPEGIEFQTELNASQQAAINHALQAQDVAIIHGPPGTGKTTTVAELILQAVRRGQKVLACAPSNLAVDNLFERVLGLGENAIRLGHPARVQPTLRQHTLDLIVDTHPDVRLARKLVREAGILRDKASRYKRAKPAPGQRRELREEARRLIADARRLEAQVVQQVLDAATVVCATTTGLDSEILGQRHFDLCVIDEACQSTEPACWIPLLRCDSLILAGDHCQLPPTVVSREAMAAGFHVSLLERLLQVHGTDIARRLNVQYRMHEAIMNFSSREFYDQSLVAAPEVAQQRLSDLAEVSELPMTTAPIEFIDTAGAGYEESREPDGESRRNLHEVDLVVNKVKALVEAGVSSSCIGVITPYAAQVRLLRDRLLDSFENLEIDTVDGFQGREKEAIVVSLVRSNTEGTIGFLADTRRMNVAITRARRKLIVIGDSATVGNHPFYSRLLEYYEESSFYHTVWEEYD